MSWHFSQALVAEFSADTSLAGELSAPSSGNPTQLAYLSHGKTTEFSRLSRFGMTCRLLTDDRGEALLTSYLAAFRANFSSQLDNVYIQREDGEYEKLQKKNPPSQGDKQ